MVRPCQSEQAVGDYFDSLLQQRVQAQAGLLVGKQCVGSKDLLLSVIHTPAQDGQDVLQCTSSASSAPAAKSKKGNSSSSSVSSMTIQVEVEWMTEHAAQVARMLPGGLSVIGVYIFCSESGYQSAAPQLLTALAALRDICPPVPDAEGRPSDLLLLHVDNGTRRGERLRGAPPGVTSPSGLKPAELKYAPCINSLVCLRASYPLALSLPAPTSVQQLQQQLTDSCNAACEAISRSTAVPQGSFLLPDEATPLVDALPAGATQPASSGSVPTATLQLLPPLPGQAQPGGASGGASTSAVGWQHEVQGQGSLRGVLQAVAFAHKREPYARAVGELKADLQRSLRTRVDLTVEDALAWAEEQQQQAAEAGGDKAAVDAAGAAAPAPSHPLLREGPLVKGWAVALPRRVLLPWTGGLMLADHLLPGEEPSAAVGRAGELAGISAELPPEQVEELEAPGTALKKVPAWQPNALPSAAAAAACKAVAGVVSGVAVQENGSSSRPACTRTVALGMATGGAAVAALLAAALGYMTLGQ